MNYIYIYIKMTVVRREKSIILKLAHLKKDIETLGKGAGKSNKDD